MSSNSSIQQCEAIVVAVSGGPDNRWSWRIVDRSGQRLLESSKSFTQLGEALEDGRRHVQTALGHESGADIARRRGDVDSSSKRDQDDTPGLPGYSPDPREGRDDD